MFKKILRALIAVVGVFLGYSVGDIIFQSKLFVISNSILLYTYYGFSMIIFGLLFYLIAPRLISLMESVIERIETILYNHPKENMIIGFIGIIIGIILAFIISFALSGFKPQSQFLQFIITIINVVLYIVLATLGYRIATRNKDDLLKRFQPKIQRNLASKEDFKKKQNIDNTNISSKLLDTSVLIDGRILQIAKTGFIDGELIIPNFVLEEIQLIADSHDELKRERGRRGFDIVNNLLDSNIVKTTTTNIDYKDINEVDLKLLKYAKEYNYSVVTNDFNLNKLAVIQGIKILNINDLANAVKTVVIPGEKMIVNIIKEGREKKQGLAYLDDGTMIVVEDGKHLIGETVEVVVTTVLQTSAGKMIFTKVEEN